MIKVSGRWMEVAQAHSSWYSKGEGYVQQWMVMILKLECTHVCSQELRLVYGHGFCLFSGSYAHFHQQISTLRNTSRMSKIDVFL